MKLIGYLSKVSRREIVLEHILFLSHLPDNFWIGKSYIQRLHGHKLQMHKTLFGLCYPGTSICDILDHLCS